MKVAIFQLLCSTTLRQAERLDSGERHKLYSENKWHCCFNKTIVIVASTNQICCGDNLIFTIWMVTKITVKLSQRNPLLDSGIIIASSVLKYRQNLGGLYLSYQKQVPSRPTRYPSPSPRDGCCHLMLTWIGLQRSPQRCLCHFSLIWKGIWVSRTNGFCEEPFPRKNSLPMISWKNRSSFRWIPSLL